MKRFHCCVPVGPFPGKIVEAADAAEAEKLYRELFSVDARFLVDVTEQPSADQR